MSARMPLFVAASLLSVVVLLMPASGVPHAPPGTDKVIHFSLFALLTATGLYAGLRPAALVPALVGWALVSEILQEVLPIRRSFELADLGMDVLGLTVALGVVIWRRRRAASLP